ncbi:hypothetical protein CZ771_00435 [Actinomycetales bacterium JB111]|nr:hypothetical protein CZ771_00435 [Actinomycetales bacterium JB111]
MSLFHSTWVRSTERRSRRGARSGRSWFTARAHPWREYGESHRDQVPRTSRVLPERLGTPPHHVAVRSGRTHSASGLPHAA